MKEYKLMVSNRKLWFTIIIISFMSTLLQIGLFLYAIYLIAIWINGTIPAVIDIFIIVFGLLGLKYHITYETRGNDK